MVGLRQQRRRGRRRRGWRRRGRRRQVAEQDEPTPPLPPTRAAQLLERPSQVVVAAATCGAWGDVHSAMAARAAEKAVATAAAAAMVLEASMAAVLVAAASEVAAPSANRHRGTLTTHYPDLENGRAVFQALPTQGIPGSGDHHRGRRRSRRHAPAAEKSTPCPNDQQYVQCTGFRFAAKVCRAMRALISTVPRRRAAREEGGYLAEIPIHGSIMSLSSSIQLFAVPPRAARYIHHHHHHLAVRHCGAASSAKKQKRCHESCRGPDGLTLCGATCGSSSRAWAAWPTCRRAICCTRCCSVSRASASTRIRFQKIARHSSTLPVCPAASCSAVQLQVTARL